MKVKQKEIIIEVKSIYNYNQYIYKMINIPQTVSDPFYRYQRPKVSIEKQKLGIKYQILTYLVNLFI